MPIYYNAKNTGRPIDPANKYTSKYLDEANTPLYPFGHGLSYTTFVYRNLRLERNAFPATEGLRFSVELQNTGSRPGTEVVQVYLQDMTSSVTRPVKELRSYQQVTLGPGESRTLEFTLQPANLAAYDLNMRWRVEPGLFTLTVMKADFNVTP